jgi:hypothetical protein
LLPSRLHGRCLLPQGHVRLPAACGGGRQGGGGSPAPPPGRQSSRGPREATVGTTRYRDGHGRGTATGKEFFCGSNSPSLVTSNHRLRIQRWGNCWRQSNTSDFSLIPIMCTQNTRSSLSFGASQSCIVHHHHLCFKYMTQLKY